MNFVVKDSYPFEYLVWVEQRELNWTMPAMYQVSYYTNIDSFVSSAMVKTTTPEVVPGAFYLPEAQPRENGMVLGSPRES